MEKLENNNAQRDFFKEIKLKYSPFHHLLKLRHLKWRHLKTKCDFKLICFKNNIKPKTEPFQVLFFFFWIK
ncbi:hypothetical protein B0X41_01245 [Helicobacter pylori]|uniref:Uncharacterized protein n=1 Tax=Helicobacter pylori TaxID=210 RepID=A0AB36KF16_HELPX|nr:hypothetical protein B0X41_01245 [Helicobacter pylori]